VTTAGARPRSREGLLWLLVLAECVPAELIYVGLIGHRAGLVIAACAAVVNVSLLLAVLLRRRAGSAAFILLLAMPILIWAISNGGAARTWIAGLPAVLVLSLIFKIVESRSGRPWPSDSDASLMAVSGRAGKARASVWKDRSSG
jgi:hypothetical protein